MIVQKYGGTSVGSPDRIVSVARKIAEAYRSGESLVVVVSAMGDTTDELIELAEKVSKNPPRREMDMLLSTGERISMALLSMALADLGVEAISLTGSQTGIVTTDSHRRARILKILGNRVREGLSQKKVVIVAGFQGVSEGKEITTLGRGGSDTTAVALAAALHAERCEIYTDVDGVYSADPRIVSQARFWPKIRSDWMIELAARGAGVLHLRSVQLAARYGVPLIVLNSMKNDSVQKGTIVINTEQSAPGMEEYRVAGITVDRSRVWCRVRLARTTAQRAIWDRALEKQLSLGMPWVYGQDLSFFAEKEALEEWKSILGDLSTQGFLESFETREDWVPLALVGDRLTQDGKALAEILQVFTEQHIETQGMQSSPLALSWIVPAHRAEDAVKALHARFEPHMVTST
jgi:aspartate kinase